MDSKMHLGHGKGSDDIRDSLLVILIRIIGKSVRTFSSFLLIYIQMVQINLKCHQFCKLRTTKNIEKNVMFWKESNVSYV